MGVLDPGGDQAPAHQGERAHAVGEAHDRHRLGRRDVVARRKIRLLRIAEQRTDRFRRGGYEIAAAHGVILAQFDVAEMTVGSRPVAAAFDRLSTRQAQDRPLVATPRRSNRISNMAVFIALLRAVNVGGTGKLPMADFKAICEAGGMRESADLHCQRQRRFREPAVGSRRKGGARGSPGRIRRQAGAGSRAHPRGNGRGVESQSVPGGCGQPDRRDISRRTAARRHHRRTFRVATARRSNSAGAKSTSITGTGWRVPN